MKIVYPQSNYIMSTYGITYSQYSIIANDFVRYVEIVETNDIYHHVGMMIYKAFYEMKNIRWFDIDSVDEFKQRMLKRDCVKLSEDCYRLTLFESEKKQDITSDTRS